MQAHNRYRTVLVSVLIRAQRGRVSIRVETMASHDREGPDADERRMPSTWTYKVCVVHNGQVIQEVKEYDILADALQKLRRMTVLYAVKAREWNDVFVMIAGRVCGDC